MNALIFVNVFTYWKSKNSIDYIGLESAPVQ